MGALSTRRHDDGMGWGGSGSQVDRWAGRGAWRDGEDGEEKGDGARTEAQKRQEDEGTGMDRFSQPKPTFYLLILSTDPSSWIRIETTHTPPTHLDLLVLVIYLDWS